jgi:transposase
MMSESQAKPKRVFTEEFKREAVRLAEERGNVCAVARDLGIHETLLRRWKQSIHEESASPNSENQPLPTFPGQGNPRDEETARLQRENRRLREEVEILKKAVGIFTSRPREIPIH